jgi:predicted esterase
MLRFVHPSVRSAFAFLMIAATLLASHQAQAQDYCDAWPGPSTPLKQKKVTNVNIPGTNAIHGYLENLPNDYAANPGKKYPLLVFIHGINESGSGSSADLCKLMSQWWWTPSTLSEWTSEPTFPASVTDQNGQTHKFILITPQIVNWDDFPNASATLNALFDYLIAKYRVDISRIYLTGLSMGANFIQSYAGASLANASRLAGLIPVAPCNYLSNAEANVIARASLPFWSFQCSSDNACSPGNKAMNNANLINSQTPATTVPAYHTTFPVPGQPCNPFPHDVWGFAYRPSFRQTVNGRSVNSYEWMVQYSRSSLLPVALESYSASLKNGKVQVRWATSAESNNARFNIERSADGKTFTEIATIPATGNSTGKAYEWIDERPLANLSYYRLTQTDINGRKEYFQIKKIMNRSVADRSMVVAPNPFTTELTAFVNVPHVQLVTISITDMSGRVLKTLSGKYAEGAAEIIMNTTDLPRGIYFLKIKGEDFAQTQKIIKQ